MRKLTLNLDEIQVESFATQSAAAARGTVDARQGRETWTCPVPTQDTCNATCEYSCDGNCGGTGATCVSCVQTCDFSCASCAATCDSCAFTCDTCLATCNYATGPQRCCA